jgi:hypothetical protein
VQQRHPFSPFNGPFANFEALDVVGGMNSSLLEAVKDLIAFDQAVLEIGGVRLVA